MEFTLFLQLVATAVMCALTILMMLLTASSPRSKLFTIVALILVGSSTLLMIGNVLYKLMVL
ncbi:MAG: hypothetical protein ACRCYS_13810 [Beijerinckiaceae bacterium]